MVRIAGGRMICFFGLLFFVVGACTAGSNTGKDYTNFGRDLLAPVFSKNKPLEIYSNKGDVKPAATFGRVATVTSTSDKATCLGKGAADGWVKCELNGVKGWVKRSDFYAPDEYPAPIKWPFRYWIYEAGRDNGEERCYTKRFPVSRI